MKTLTDVYKNIAEGILDTDIDSLGIGDNPLIGAFVQVGTWDLKHQRCEVPNAQEAWDAASSPKLCGLKKIKYSQIDFEKDKIICCWDKFEKGIYIFFWNPKYELGHAPTQYTALPNVLHIDIEFKKCWLANKAMSHVIRPSANNWFILKEDVFLRIIDLLKIPYKIH